MLRFHSFSVKNLFFLSLFLPLSLAFLPLGVSKALLKTGDERESPIYSDLKILLSNELRKKSADNRRTSGVEIVLE